MTRNLNAVLVAIAIIATPADSESSTRGEPYNAAGRVLVKYKPDSDAPKSKLRRNSAPLAKKGRLKPQIEIAPKLLPEESDVRIKGQIDI
jgi:hypothetical protein